MPLHALLGFLFSVYGIAARLTEWRLNVGLPLARQSNDQSSVEFLAPPGHYAGYYSLDGTEDGHLFYVFFENRRRRPEAPLILWTNGGPGCASMYGLFYENGPYRIRDDLSLEWNPYGWDLMSNIIFVDHPLNVGYSYGAAGDWVETEAQVAEHLLQFVFEFLDAHPDMQSKPFLLAGESFAGHYLPVLAERIVVSNAGSPRHRIDLEGLALGDPWISPSVQFRSYPEYEYSKGLINATMRDAMLERWKFCDYDLSMCRPSDPSYSRDVCQAGYDFCNEALFYPIFGIRPGLNYYNIKKECVSSDCSNVTLLNAFMNLPEVKRMFDISSDVEWKDCNDDVYFALLWDCSRDYAPLVGRLLDHGIRVLVYVGDDDLVCNHIGNRAWVDALSWTGSRKRKNSEVKVWTINGMKTGEITRSGGLAFLRLFECGHMVPEDRPAAALEMMETFANGIDAWETETKPAIHPSIVDLQF